MTLFLVSKGAGVVSNRTVTAGGVQRKSEWGAIRRKTPPTPPRAQSYEGGRWDNVERASGEPPGLSEEKVSPLGWRAQEHACSRPRGPLLLFHHITLPGDGCDLRIVRVRITRLNNLPKMTQQERGGTGLPDLRALWVIRW